MKKRVLGLDLGIGSLGWAVVDLDEELLESSDNDKKESKYKITNGKIVATGVRIFDEPVDRQGKSLAAARGVSRRSRATTERKAERLKYLIRLAKEYGIIADTFTIKNLNVPKKVSIKDWDIWKLRADAIYKKLSPIEIFRILYHIANHRGFYFPTKAEVSELENKKSNKSNGDDKEDKKAKAGIVAVKNAYKSSECKTIGEFIFQKEGSKHNKKNDYSVSLYRDDLCDEVKKILQFQRENGNALFTPEFETRYINEVLMYTHPIDDDNIRKMIGECELIPGQLRFPKQGYEAELFTFYNRLNNLLIQQKQSKSESKISEEEKRARKKAELEQTRERVNAAAKKVGYLNILDYVLKSKNCKLTFAELRKLLQLNNDEKFNLCSYHEFNPEYQKSIKFERNKIDEFKPDTLLLYDAKTGEDQNSCWSAFKPVVEKYFEKYDNAKSVKYYYSDIRKQLNIHNELRFENLKSSYCLSAEEIGIDKYLAQFEKEIFVEFPGYLMLRKGLEEDFLNLSKDNLNDIAEALVYCQSDDTRKKYLEERGITDEALINKILELNMKEVAFFSREALHKLNEKMKDGILFNDAKEELGFEVVKKEKASEIAPYHGVFEKNATVARIIAEFRKTVNAINKKYKVIDEIHIELATDVANSKDKIMRIRNEQIRYKEQRDAAKERCLACGIDPNTGDNLLRFRLAEEQDFKCIYTGKQIYLGASENTPTDWISIFDCDIDHIIPISRSFNDSLSNKVICSNLANREKRNRLPYEWFMDKGKIKTAEDRCKAEEKWREFKVRVLTGNKMSGAKRHNLLKEKFDEEDMKNFISRDLNNTRYATRHIAEYLREYFSFEHSQNTMIKDSNRIRVLGGGITAKLRHLWGLDKDRDESNLHHAQDAVVIACASFRNIYYICSILKELEERGIRPQKTQLGPWSSFRDDLKKSLSEIKVSKLVRASATGQIHKQPDKKKKGYTLIKRRNAENVIDVVLDSMFRYDIYRNDKGYYCMPIYAIDLHNKDFKYTAIQGKNEIEALQSDFVFSLYKGSLVKIITKDNEIFEGYVVKYKASTLQFVLESISGNRCYEINTSTFEIGDHIHIYENNIQKNYLVDNFNEETQKLSLKSLNEGDDINVTAKVKIKENKNTGEEKVLSGYQIDKTYIKADKEKNIKISVIKDFQKFTIDRLGAVTRVKKETERFSQKVKSNKQRIADRKARREKVEQAKAQE